MRDLASGITDYSVAGVVPPVSATLYHNVVTIQRQSSHGVKFADCIEVKFFNEACKGRRNQVHLAM